MLTPRSAAPESRTRATATWSPTSANRVRLSPRPCVVRTVLSAAPAPSREARQRRDNAEQQPRQQRYGERASGNGAADAQFVEVRQRGATSGGHRARQTHGAASCPRARPPAPPAIDSITFSVRSCVTSRPRPAPMADRTDSSRVRGRCARQQQPRDRRARRQKDESHRGQQRANGWTNGANDDVAQRHRAEECVGMPLADRAPRSRGNRVEIRGGLRGSHVALAPAEDVHPVPVAALLLLRRRRIGSHSSAESSQRELEVRRQDRRDRVRLPVENERAPETSRIARRNGASRPRCERMTPRAAPPRVTSARGIVRPARDARRGARRSRRSPRPTARVQVRRPAAQRPAAAAEAGDAIEAAVGAAQIDEVRVERCPACRWIR